jgi:CO/xanthine dehydrogenase FAD-binding subunit
VQDFNFYRAESVDEALKILKEKAGRVKVISGGTDVLIDMRNGDLPGETELVLDISGLEELKGLRVEEGMVHIAGATLLAEIAEDRQLRERCAVLAEAADSVGSQQIRNRGTIGGNIVTAAQCADTAPPLMVLEATVVLASAEGSREVPITEFFTGPKSTAVGPEELVVEIVFPLPAKSMRGTFEKLIRREAVAKSRLGLCLLVDRQKDGTVGEARLSIGSSLPTHGRFPTVEKMLAGKKPDAKLLHEAGIEAGEYMVKIGGYRWSTDYKMPVVQSLTERCLKRVLEV